MPPEHPDGDFINALEVNDCGDELPGRILPFPQICAHPEHSCRVFARYSHRLAILLLESCLTRATPP